MQTDEEMRRRAREIEARNRVTVVLSERAAEIVRQVRRDSDTYYVAGDCDE